MNERRIRLLIIDDESEICAVYGDFFWKRDFDVETAKDGLEGLQKLREGVFDVALVDIRMPEPNGIELANRVAEEGIDTSLIILTGHGDKEDAIQAINSGAVEGWFEKASIDMEDLLAKVRELAEVLPLNEVRRILSTIPENER